MSLYAAIGEYIQKVYIRHYLDPMSKEQLILYISEHIPVSVSKYLKTETDLHLVIAIINEHVKEMMS